MKASQTLILLAAAFGSAKAGYNATVTDIASYTTTVPCTTTTPVVIGTGTGTGGFTATANGTFTYSKPSPSPSTSTAAVVTSTPSSVVTAGAGSLDPRVFVGAVAAVAAIAFTL